MTQPAACPNGFPVKAPAAEGNGVRSYLLPVDPGYAEAALVGCFQTEDEAQATGWSR